MKAKRLAISVFTVIFVIFTLISFFIYDNSTSVAITTESGSYAETYAKEHNLDYEIISDTQKDMIQHLESFEYNDDGTIVSYSGNSSVIAIPKKIDGVTITAIADNAFANAKNLTKIYISDDITVNAETIKGFTVYAPAELKGLSELKKAGIEFKNYADSETINFNSAEIPFEYDVKNNEVTVNKFTGSGEVIVPAYISGNPVTTVNIDALSDGITSMFIPSTVKTIEKDLYTARYDVTFAIGILIALVGLAIAIFGTAKANLSSKEKTFLNVSFITESYALSIASVVMGIIFYCIVPVVWVGILFAVLLAAFGFITFSKAKVAIDEIERVGEKVKTQTQYIKLLTVDAESLMSRAATDSAKSSAKKVYEAVRYSDPMSNDALSVIEAKITVKMDEFSSAVNAKDDEKINAIADELVILLGDRNKKCKVLK